MLHIEPLHTSRLRVSMRELGIGNAITVGMMPEYKQEASTTAFLRAVITDGGDNAEPALWTVQERALATGNYLMAVHREQRDFPVGPNGRFSDYLDAARDVPMGTFGAPLYVGDVADDKWSIQHLLGYMAEAIERLQGQIEVPGGDQRMHWLFGAMAAQLVHDEAREEEPDWAVPGLYDDWLADKMRVMLALPESAAMQLRLLYEEGTQKLYHLFNMRIGKEGGLVFLPREGKGAEAGLPPATFPAHSCISEFARAMGGKSAETGQ